MKDKLMADAFKLFKNLEYLFIIIIIFTIGYAGHAFLSKDNMIEAVMVPTLSKEDQTLVSEDVPSIELKPYDTYSQQMSARDIFSKAKTAEAKQTTPSGQLPDNLKIVGIVLGEEPQIVIEDTNSHQTYFIDRKSPIIGISIGRVEQNKIILNYQGQNIEVPLKGNEINVAKQTL